MVAVFRRKSWTSKRSEGDWERAILFANISAPDLVPLIQRAEADTVFQLLVFASADPDYLISHVDVTRINEYREQAARLAGEASLGLPFRDWAQAGS